MITSSGVPNRKWASTKPVKSQEKEALDMVSEGGVDSTESDSNENEEGA